MPQHAPAVPEPGDAELVRIAQSAPGAFAPLYLRYRDAVMNYCYYRLGNQQDAEDAAGAVFVKALGNLPRFSARGDSFRSWLFSIAHNEIADRHRHRGRHPETTLLPALTVVDGSPLPEDAVIASDRRARVLMLLNRLPERERTVLELRAAELSTSEIATVLGASEQSVRTAQSRAIARLRSLLGDEAALQQEAVNA